jgi:hypothetical protein
MKLKALLLGLLGSLLIAVPAFAAGVDGNWSGTLDSPNGPVQIDYVFKSDGAKLTGTTTGPDGTKLAIKDGKIDGNNISFAVDVDFGGSPTTIKYTGVVAADSIALTMDFQGMPVNITVKKAAAK